MSSRFFAPPEQLLASAFASHVVRWARERDAPNAALAALEVAAYAASIATASGHVCTHLADVVALADARRAEQSGESPAATPHDGLADGARGHAGDASGARGARIAADPHARQQALRAALLASSLVGTPEAPASHPLILDGGGRLYLHRYFDYERRLAARLHRPASPVPDPAGVRALLDRLFGANAGRLGDRPDWQKIATALALRNPLTLVSGGPGTGKTTTVVNVLACALALDPGCRIALAAPTGKAATRMLEAIRATAARLPEALHRRLPGEAFTVHRLLGARPESGEFRHHAANPLPVDLLVVDEASMLDLALAARLVEAVPAAARIVLLGDKDQLAAVEAGAVFAELASDPTLGEACVADVSALTSIAPSRIRPPAPARPTGLTDSVVWLTENFRFGSGSAIGRLAAHVNRGEAQAALDLLRSASDPGLAWIDDGGRVPRAESLARILAGMASYVDAMHSGAGASALFGVLGRVRVLCAEREGPRGVAEINRAVARHVRGAIAHPLDPGSRSQWYPGRPVMVLRNDYVLQLFNGDVGIALPDASGGIAVFFPRSDGSFRAVSPLRLPEHETAFATTVHKAQGSEFDEVLLLLPAVPARVVSRELLYTAVTRARSGVTLIGSAEVLEAAIASPTRRYSGLLSRIEEAARTR